MANPPGATHYIPVTSNPALVPSAQANFTADLIIDEALAINDEGSALAFVRALAADYSDLQVTNNAGDVNWSFNVDEFDQTPGTTKLVMAIRIPSLSGAVGVVAKPWRGCTGGPFSSGPNTYRVADGWAARYSLKEAAAGTGTADVYKDSTANVNDGDDWVSAVGKTGQVGLGQQFDGDDYITVPRHASLEPTAALTVSAWVNFDDITPAANENIVGKHIGGAGGGYQLYLNSSTEMWWLLRDGGVSFWLMRPYPGAAGTYMYVAATYDDAANELRLQFNGTSHSAVTARALPHTIRDLTIGAYIPGTAELNGYLDELHVCSVARAVDWLTTEYNCGDDNDAFWTVGAEQPVAVPPHTFGDLPGLTQIADRTPGLGIIAERDIDWWIDNRL